MLTTRHLSLLRMAILLAIAATAMAPSWSGMPLKRRDAGALQSVHTAVQEAARHGRRPVVVFDLDHTLFDGRPRTLRILQEFAAQADDADLAAKITALPAARVYYDLRATLANAGITEATTVAAATEFWRERFFSDAYVVMDVALAGAAAYVRSLHAAGAQVVYLTGRWAPTMLVGTVAALQTAGMPVGIAGTHLILKPDPMQEDATFKRDALAAIAALGRVVAVFENEPENLRLLADAFPKAIPVFLDTDHKPDTDPTLPRRALIIDGYAGAY